MQKKYVVRLTQQEREALNLLLDKPRACAQKLRRARVLLKADANAANWPDAKIAEAFDCTLKSVENIRQRLVTEGFDVALNGQRKRRVRSKTLDGEQEAKVIALRLGSPPKGFANWTLRLLAQQVVSLEIAESLSHETLRRLLKKVA
jgi:transposase